jgi:hypothetical protein
MNDALNNFCAFGWNDTWGDFDIRNYHDHGKTEVLQEKTAFVNANVMWRFFGCGTLLWKGLCSVALLDSSWNVMAHGDSREGKWRGNWRMEWVVSTLHTTSEHGVSSITTADAHTSAASSRLNWRPWRFKWTRPFRRKTKSGFCACAITFQTQSNAGYTIFRGSVKSTGYPVLSPVSPSLPLPCVTVCHHISTGA